MLAADRQFECQIAVLHNRFQETIPSPLYGAHLEQITPGGVLYGFSMFSPFDSLEACPVF